MRRSGRPLRFLLGVCAGWIGMRTLLLWPVPVALPTALGLTPVPAALPPPPAPPPVTTPVPVAIRSSVLPARRSIATPSAWPAMLLATQADAGPSQVKRTPGAPDGPAGDTLFPAPVRSPLLGMAAMPRWSGDAWLLARGGGGLDGATLPAGGSLGGAQAGARLRYAIDRQRRLGGYARVASPLTGQGRDVALGLEWQPTRAPVRLFVEQRWQIDAGSGGPAAGVVGGFGPVTLGADIAAEGYGAAGMTTGHAGQRFAEGSLRVARPLASIGDVTLDLGAGGWGGAQRGTARLDVGPSLGLAVPLGDRRVRFQLDWRERVAGRARPGSGPALTVATGF